MSSFDKLDKNQRTLENANKIAEELIRFSCLSFMIKLLSINECLEFFLAIFASLIMCPYLYYCVCSVYKKMETDQKMLCIVVLGKNEQPNMEEALNAVQFLKKYTYN